jgi:hypothetical protein
MTIERAFLWFAEAVMLVALVLFLRGFAVRKSDRALHMKLGKSGALLVFVGLLAVEVLLRGMGWHFPIRSHTMLHAHITVASLALLFLIGLVVTGMKGPARVHVKLWLFFFPLYVATIVLSAFAFALW